MKSTSERGYGTAHQNERKRWQRIIDRTPVLCARGCDTLIGRGDQWDLGHTDDRTAWTGPECVSCNRSAGGRNGNRAMRDRRETTIRDW